VRHALVTWVRNDDRAPGLVSSSSPCCLRNPLRFEHVVSGFVRHGLQKTDYSAPSVAFNAWARSTHISGSSRFVANRDVVVRL
jgi:hypothetical protein